MDCFGDIRKTREDRRRKMEEKADKLIKKHGMSNAKEEEEGESTG